LVAGCSSSIGTAHVASIGVRSGDDDARLGHDLVGRRRPPHLVPDLVDVVPAS
jgi:hypothetical protein